ncbi:hypothetical protein ETH_00023575 [Eimeria tenella]|uniref:Uncharacterized protein n=1 Tax=Eimeria tenella TaxID=5802 RepID=U6KZ22_EIMTE|nr:hypothetical protein ETH_00023575 [Eimeria tenella]CDJ42183.1 hypothetical protein ETH_00023575 [Eimeria tenella]|eukprot:XP_013232933.1 hypothetical protein ETH_00023575 [Eimeria tenella]
MVSVRNNPSAYKESLQAHKADPAGSCAASGVPQSLVTRAKNLPRVNTQEMLMELVIRGDLLQIDEFEAAKSIRTVERKIESAREQHQALINTLTDNQQLQTAEEAQSTSQGAKNIQTVLEAAREQELRRLLLPELPILSQTPSSSRRPTADSEALKAVKVQGMQIPTICNGPGTLVALSLQPESSIKAAGTMPWSDARRRRVEEMAILLKAQPKEDFTDPRDECRIAETIKSLNAYNLTNSGSVTEASL